MLLRLLILEDDGIVTVAVGLLVNVDDDDVVVVVVNFSLLVIGVDADCLFCIFFFSFCFIKKELALFLIITFYR